MTGSLFIVCAPSGTGKTSLVRDLLATDPAIRLSVSHTTRGPRAGEIDGREYHFVTEAVFKRMQQQNDFLESAHVHGNYYGTSRRWIAEQHAAGSDILLEIDWQGAAQVRKLMPEVVNIFILPPSLDALRARLVKRALDTPEVIARRIEAARSEIRHVGEFNYVIMNDDFDQALLDLKSIVRAQRLLGPAQLSRHSGLIKLMRQRHGTYHRRRLHENRSQPF